MANIFPRAFNWLPIQVGVTLAMIGPLVGLGVWYYFTPKYARVGYMPTQPVAFSHALHAGELGMDCRYCHSYVDQGAHANIPTSQTCYNCHRPGGIAYGTDEKINPKLEPIIKSYQENKPFKWVRIHKMPDYAYFNHAVHVNRGVSCVQCHGQINNMEVVWHDQPLSMAWCLECHREPEKFIRPVEHVYNLDWKPESDEKQIEMGNKLVAEWNVHPPVNCAGCHR